MIAHVLLTVTVTTPLHSVIVPVLTDRVMTGLVVKRAIRVATTQLYPVKLPQINTLPSGCAITVVIIAFAPVVVTKLVSNDPSVLRRAIRPPDVQLYVVRLPPIITFQFG